MISPKTAKSSQTGSRSNRATTRQRRGAANRKTGVSNLSKRAPRKKTPEQTRPPRKDSKQQVCLKLLCRSEGANIEELQQVTGWQTHTVRGFLSGAVKRKLGLELVSQKPEHQPRRYRIPQATL